MSERVSIRSIDIGGRRWRVDGEPYDLSIPLAFDRPQPTFFGAPPAREHVVSAGSFVGDVREGGSCNCSTYTLTPHCNGTHTECIGHLTRERMSVRDVCTEAFHLAVLLTVEPMRATETSERTDPAPEPNDRFITRSALEAAANALDIESCNALVVRTTPNEERKRVRDYDKEPAPFFSAEAMEWIVAQGVEHLVTDLPSLDRANDQGRLTAHRIFWNMPPGSVVLRPGMRAKATVTELAFIPNALEDGAYLLNLQIPPFAADAAPSRPILMRVRAA